MDSIKLALFNVRNNILLFKFNLITMVFSIAVFFNFFSLIFNPSLSLVGSNQSIVAVTVYMTALVLVFFITFLIFYSNSFFLKQRKKEIGIYMFMGVDNSEIAAVFAIENLVLGLLALIPGLFFGIIFQKAFLMLLTKVASFRTEVTFYLSIEAIIITAIIFMLIFSLTALKGFRSIKKSKLIDLLNAEKREDRVLKTRYFTAAIAVMLIAIAGYYSKNIFTVDFFTNATIVMGCIVLGTFLLFSSFIAVVMKLLVNNKRILYNGTNLVCISNIAYRIRNNYKILACVTIIVAAAISSIGAAFTVQYLFMYGLEISHPYSFTYVSVDGNVDEMAADIINSSQHEITQNIKTNYLVYDSQKNTLSAKPHPVLKLSDFNRITSGLGVDSEALNETGQLIDGLVISVMSSNDSGFKENQLLDMCGMTLKVKETLSVPLLGAQFDNNAIIMTDNDYNQFKEKCEALKSPVNEKVFNGIIVSNQEDSRKLSEALAEIPGLENNLTSYIAYYDYYNQAVGFVKFTALFLGVVFMLSTASIMYMKISSDAIEDKEKYAILMKIGMSESELYRTVSKQVGFSYLLPLAMGALYGAMAINALQSFLNSYLEISLLTPYLLSLSVYVVVYICFYLLTTRKFVNLVKS